MKIALKAFIFLHFTFFLFCLNISAELLMDIWHGFDSLHLYNQSLINFHNNFEIAPNSIKLVEEVFLSWFTPIPYIIPFYISKFLGINLHLSFLICTFSLGVSISFLLYNYINNLAISNNTKLYTFIILSSNYLLFENYYSAQSSDIYMIFFLLILLRFSDQYFIMSKYSSILFIIIFSSFGFYVKSTALLISSSFFLALNIAQIENTPNLSYFKKKFPSFLLVLSGILLSIIITHFTFSQFGEHSGYPRILKSNILLISFDYLYSFAGVYFSLFSIDKTIDFLIKNSLHLGPPPIEIAVIYFIFSIILVILTIRISFYFRHSTEYKKALITIIIIGLSTFILRIFNSGIDYNFRIYFFSAILFAPFFIEFITNWLSRKLIRYLFFLVTFFPILLISIGKRNQNRDFTCETKSGFSYKGLRNDCEIVDVTTSYIREDDYKILLLPYYDFSLEFKGIKTVPYHEPWNYIQSYYKSNKFKAKDLKILLLSYKEKSQETELFFKEHFENLRQIEVLDSTEKFNLYKIVLSDFSYRI